MAIHDSIDAICGRRNIHLWLHGCHPRTP